MTLSNMALSAIQLGEYEKAKSFASKHYKIALSCDIMSELQVGQALRGLVALRTGHLNAAKNELLGIDDRYIPHLAAKKLASELLEAVETPTVLQFFDSMKDLKLISQGQR